jgi:cytochrome c-type biogenesis protein CcmE
MLSKYKRKRLGFIVTTALISLVALVFIVENFRENIVFFYSPSELRKVQNIAKRIKVGGLVKEGSIKKIDASHTDFIITDLKNELLIRHEGILPELFREKQGVVASGFLNEAKSEFSSRDLLIKHDEKYMPPEVAESLKKEAY